MDRQDSVAMSVLLNHDSCQSSWQRFHKSSSDRYFLDLNLSHRLRSLLSEHRLVLCLLNTYYVYGISELFANKRNTLASFNISFLIGPIIDIRFGLWNIFLSSYAYSYILADLFEGNLINARSCCL